jgi:hypothetical protein
LEYISAARNKTRYCRFLDGDYSDYPQDLTQIIARYWMIILILLLAPSSTFTGKHSMTPQQVLEVAGNNFNESFFYATFTDLGPFRAIKYEKLVALNMEDKTYGWTVENAT